MRPFSNAFKVDRLILALLDNSDWLRPKSLRLAAIAAPISVSSNTMHNIQDLFKNVKMYVSYITHLY